MSYGCTEQQLTVFTRRREILHSWGNCAVLVDLYTQTWSYWINLYGSKGLESPVGEGVCFVGGRYVYGKRVHGPIRTPELISAVSASAFNQNTKTRINAYDCELYNYIYIYIMFVKRREKYGFIFKTVNLRQTRFCDFMHGSGKKTSDRIIIIYRYIRQRCESFNGEYHAHKGLNFR